MKKQNILISGGAGFIGSHLCEVLYQRGHKIIVIDDLSTGKLENIKGIYHEFINGSITDLTIVNDACKNVDLIFHLAAMNCVPKSIENPIDSNHVNIQGTLNMLFAAKQNKVKKVIYVSSSSIYSGKGNAKKDESFELNPDTPYGVEKLTGEYYCGVFKNLYGLSTVCLRYFSVYGERQRCDVGHAAVIPVFIEKMKRGIAPIIYGNGNQTRPFTYVEDVIDGSLICADNDLEGAFNIAYPRSYSINDLVFFLNKLMKTDIKPIYTDERKGDIEFIDADISKLSMYGFIPRYNLEQGLERLLNIKNEVY